MLEKFLSYFSDEWVERLASIATFLVVVILLVVCVLSIFLLIWSFLNIVL